MNISNTCGGFYYVNTFHIPNIHALCGISNTKYHFQKLGSNMVYKNLLRVETTMSLPYVKQDAQLSQRDRAAGCVTVFAKSRRLELGDNI